MTNRNYNRGRAKEYRVAEQYRKNGCLVIRAAKSHGFADLVAVHPKTRHIFFVQCKPRKYSKKAKARLEKQFEWLNDEFICQFQVE